MFASPKSHGKPLTSFVLERAEIKLRVPDPDDEGDGDEYGAGYVDSGSGSLVSHAATAGTGTGPDDPVWVVVPLPSDLGKAQGLLHDSSVTIGTSDQYRWQPADVADDARCGRGCGVRSGRG